MKKYKLIYADPPWEYNSKFVEVPRQNARSTGATDHYETMSLESIMKLPILDLSDKNAVLFLWATTPLLHEAFHVMKSWDLNTRLRFIGKKPNARD